MGVKNFRGSKKVENVEVRGIQNRKLVWFTLGRKAQKQSKFNYTKTAEDFLPKFHGTQYHTLPLPWPKGGGGK